MGFPHHGIPLSWDSPERLKHLQREEWVCETVKETFYSIILVARDKHTFETLKQMCMYFHSHESHKFIQRTRHPCTKNECQWWYIFALIKTVMKDNCKNSYSCNSQMWYQKSTNLWNVICLDKNTSEWTDCTLGSTSDRLRMVQQGPLGTVQRFPMQQLTTNCFLMAQLCFQ